MVDWNRKFRSEYDAAREALAAADAFDPDWQPVVTQLASMMGHDGFDVGRADALDELRSRATQGPDATRVDEADGLLRAAAPIGAGGLVPEDARRRAAAIKLLHHVHLESRSGSRGVWIVSLPSAFTNWPSAQFADEAANVAGARKLLAARHEHFDTAQRRWLGVATPQGLGWCQRAAIVLADARRARGGAQAQRPGGCEEARAEARAVVRRWFAEPAASEAAVDRLVATLTLGFKDIVASLNRGRFVITDWVPFRAANGAAESEFLRAEAFAFRAHGEGMDVVYVEGAFFDDIAGKRAARPGELDPHPRARTLAPGLRHAGRQRRPATLCLVRHWPARRLPERRDDPQRRQLGILRGGLRGGVDGGAARNGPQEGLSLTSA
jgi:hypothetical protein